MDHQPDLPPDQRAPELELLGELPVLPTSLTGAGQQLHAVLADHPDLPGALDAATAAQLPAAGWRLVAQRGDFLTFAAPSREPGA